MPKPQPKWMQDYDPLNEDYECALTEEEMREQRRKWGVYEEDDDDSQETRPKGGVFASPLLDPERDRPRRPARKLQFFALRNSWQSRSPTVLVNVAICDGVDRLKGTMSAEILTRWRNITLRVARYEIRQLVRGGVLKPSEVRGRYQFRIPDGAEDRQQWDKRARYRRLYESWVYDSNHEGVEAPAGWDARRKWYGRMNTRGVGYGIIPARALLVYAVLYDKSDSKGYCWDPLPVLAAQCRCSKPQLTQALAQLEKAHWIDIQRRGYEPREGQPCNKYTVLVKPRLLKMVIANSVWQRVPKTENDCE
jgi:hypothetical protein